VSKEKSLQIEQDRARVQPSTLNSAASLVNVIVEVALTRTLRLQLDGAKNKCRQHACIPPATIAASVMTGTSGCELLEVRTTMVAATVKMLGGSKQGDGGYTDGTQSATVHSICEGSCSKVTERAAV
jgi:hypothetical protein